MHWIVYVLEPDYLYSIIFELLPIKLFKWNFRFPSNSGNFPTTMKRAYFQFSDVDLLPFIASRPTWRGYRRNAAKNQLLIFSPKIRINTGRRPAQIKALLDSLTQYLSGDLPCKWAPFENAKPVLTDRFHHCWEGKSAQGKVGGGQALPVRGVAWVQGVVRQSDGISLS